MRQITRQVLACMAGVEGEGEGKKRARKEGERDGRGGEACKDAIRDLKIEVFRQ